MVDPATALGGKVPPVSQHDVHISRPLLPQIQRDGDGNPEVNFVCGFGGGNLQKVVNCVRFSPLGTERSPSL
jgi:hypothetical protein